MSNGERIGRGEKQRKGTVERESDAERGDGKSEAVLRLRAWMLARRRSAPWIAWTHNSVDASGGGMQWRSPKAMLGW